MVITCNISIASGKSDTDDNNGGTRTIEDDLAFAKLGLSNLVKLKNLNKLFSSDVDGNESKEKDTALGQTLEFLTYAEIEALDGIIDHIW